jgi:hypothetical protein
MMKIAASRRMCLIRPITHVNAVILADGIYPSPAPFVSYIWRNHPESHSSLLSHVAQFAMTGLLSSLHKATGNTPMPTMALIMRRQMKPVNPRKQQKTALA